MNLELIGTIFLLTLLIFMTCNYMRYRRKYRFLKTKLGVVLCEKRVISSECSELRKKVSRHKTFSANLRQAEVVNTLRASRVDERANIMSAKTPERYQYVSTLSEIGMEPENIAALLSISHQESEQLVALSRIAASR